MSGNQGDGGVKSQLQIAYAASEWFVLVFGTTDPHTRAAVSANALPFEGCVEVELMPRLPGQTTY